MIVTVLRSGGDFAPEHVLRLYAQCQRFAPGVPFICLSDMPIPEPGILTVAFETAWPGWWAKMEVFRVPGPVLYMDLDTTIVGDLSPLLAAAYSHQFIALRDFNPQSREMGSGLMAWSGSMVHLWLEFRRRPEQHMRQCSTPRFWGDQGFIEPRTPARQYWQTLLPRAVVSYKKHCRDGVPDGARVVCYHGHPRPWEVE